LKTIITSTGNSASALFDKRFGRATWFCLYDQATGDITFHENQYHQAANGAGLKAAEQAGQWQASKIISGDFGPKAKELLDKLGIQLVVLSDDDITIAEIIEKLQNQ